MFLQILFWVLFILLCIGAFVPDGQSPFIGRGRWAVALILIGILGFRVFGAALR